MKSKRTTRSLPEKSTKMYQLKIALAHIEPPVWRGLLVRGDANLGFLHAVIQVAMGWTNSHLHQFTIKGKRYSAPETIQDVGLGEEPDPDEEQAVLMDVLPRAISQFFYEYDFGDSWEHIITVEKISKPDASCDFYARCLDGGRCCPPEDCGGAWGYEDLIEIINNPKHEEYADIMEWLGGKFDPDAFNKDTVNRYLDKLKWPHTTVPQLAKVLMERDGVSGTGVRS